MATPGSKNAVSELVEKARLEGELDPYVGKRLWKRYRYGTRLEVTRDPAVFASSWYVTTHNVSAGGVGFWSKQAFSLGDPIFARERSTGKPGPWLSTHVRYCVLGVNGYLVGISFDQPGDPDAIFGARHTKEADSPAEAPSRGHAAAFFSSLRNRSGFATALIGVTIYLGTFLFLQRINGSALPLAYWVAGGLVSTAIGFVIGWLLLCRESHALAAIRRATDGLSCGTPETAPLPEASTQEVAEVRQAILDLGIRWQQQADLERVQRQRLEEISQIKTNVLSTVSHDLRTPLTSIQLYTQMLEEDLKGLAEADQRKFLGVISEECTRLSRLVDDLLEVQRLERDDIDWPTQSHNLADTVRSLARAFEPIAFTNGLEFLVHCPDKLTEIRINPDKIAQAINNLLSNSLKFTPSGGKILLSVKMTNAEIVICVADTGKGIPREKWDAVFDRFMQLSGDTGPTNKGVGLGLYITRQIVERHKGRLWLDSEVGSGTEFYIALPICRRAQVSDLAGASDYVAGQVVICDADPDLCSVIAQELREHGFEVRQAHCASRFFEQLSERPPDIVICDIVLPDMACQEFIDSLGRIESRTFQLILHSAAGSFDDLRRLGADVVLRRPLTRPELVEAVGVAMYNRRADRGAIVSVITGWGLDGDRMTQVLTANGHLPVAVKDTTEAIESMHRYPIDAVVAFVGPEGAKSPTRYALESELPVGAHLFGLTSIPDKNICRKDSTELVTLVPYRVGQEESVVMEIARVIEAEKAGAAQ